MLAAVITAALGAIVLHLIYRKLTAGPNINHIPILNPKAGSWFGGSDKAHREKFLSSAYDLMVEGIKKYNGKPFRLATHQGEKVVLSPDYVDAVKSDPRLSFDAAVKKSMFAEMWGFEAVFESAHTGIVRDMVRIKLTQNLTKVTKDLAKEVSSVLEERWGNSTEFHNVDLGEDVLKLVARLSTRVFLGEELVRNQEWLDIAVNYTVTLFQAARKLREWPEPLQPIANLFLKSSRDLREAGNKAKSIIEPIVEARRAARNKPGFVRPNDTLEWLEEISKGRKYDPTMLQLALTMAAIHTTADLTKITLLSLAQHPEVLPEMRKEMADILPQGGWEKLTLYKLQLLDSAVKEAQRVKPIGMAAMGRMVVEDFTLPDGTFLPKGAEIMTSSHRMWDAELHPNPTEYDAHRFVNIRRTPGLENTGQLVTTAADHLAFGHGKHACPGRFFAANEVKIATAYAVMNYDIKLASEKKPEAFKIGFELIADPAATIQVRRRKPELDLDSL